VDTIYFFIAQLALCLFPVSNFIMRYPTQSGIILLRQIWCKSADRPPTCGKLILHSPSWILTEVVFDHRRIQDYLCGYFWYQNVCCSAIKIWQKRNPTRRPLPCLIYFRLWFPSRGICQGGLLLQLTEFDAYRTIIGLFGEPRRFRVSDMASICILDYDWIESSPFT